MSSFFTLPGVIAGLVTMVGLYGVYRLFQYLHARDHREAPAVVSSDSARRHLAVIYLIRGAEALLVIPILLVIVLIGSGILFATDRFLLFIVLISFLLVGAWKIIRDRAGFSKLGREMFRKIQEVNAKFKRVSANNIGNFAFIFAAFAAHDLYRLMPAKPLKIDPGTSGLMMSFFNRDVLWIFVFLGLWYGLKKGLGRLLELTPYSRSQDTSPDDPTIPEFPKRSPLVEL